MKRIHSKGTIEEHNDSNLDSQSQVDDSENEFSKKLNSNGVNNISDIKRGHILENKEVTEPCDRAKMQSSVNDEKDILKSCCEEGINKIPEKELNNMEKISEKKVEMLLEAISSDDDIAMDSEEDGILDSDSEHSSEFSNDFVKDFIPSLFEATPLRTIQDPSLSLWEYIHRKLSDNSKCEEVAELMDCLEYLQSKNVDINEKWIITAERTVLILPKTLCHILNIPEYCHKLFSLVNITLDFECASKEHTTMSTLILRHLKIGLQLIEVLCHYNEDLSEHLIKHHKVHNKLIHLFFIENMSVSLKLNILRALDSTLNGSEPIRLFLFTEVYDNQNGYQTLLKILSIHQKPRECFLVTSILRKIHFYELLQKLNVDTNISDSNSQLLQESLSEITSIYVKAPILMGCPKRFLQARTQFELTPALTHFDVYPTIYRLFDDLSIINCIIKLLNKSNVKSSLEKKVLKLLQSLMDCDHGLRYLGCRHKEFNELIKVLNKINSQLNLSIIYKAKVLSLVDYLSYFWECNLMHNFKLDQMESVDILYDVFLLTQSTTGKCAVVNVLTMGENLDVILNFFKYMEPSRSKNDDLHIMYAFDLLKIVLENSEDVVYLRKYGTFIYELACKHNFNDFIAWTFPAMKRSTFFHDDVNELCNIVKNNIDNCLNFNKTLITSLRILKYLGVSNDEAEFDGVEDFVELKYKYSILQMYSYDLLGNLLTITDKICDNYMHPSVNVWKFSVNRAKNVIFIIRPSMVLIKCMITLLIKSRGNDFKDLSPIKTLLKLYNLMYHTSECSIVQEDTTKVVKDIQKTLETYVEIKTGSSMINEIIVWTLSSPTVFYPGLLLLCKLLPLPLPIQTIKPLDESIVTTMISIRNMWTDHLIKININFVELITVLGSSSLLLPSLKCLCIQISDLSLSTCMLVAQTLLDVLIIADNDCFNRYLDLLTQLCDNEKQTILKIAVLKILNEEKSQQNYEKIILKICEDIKIRKQVNTILFVKCLCDSDFILTENHSEENLPRDSVPNKWFLNNILKALLSLFEVHTQFFTASLIIKTCAVIIKNDYGFYQFKMILDLFSNPFYHVFYNLLQNWNNENVHCVNTLIYMMQLLNLCIKNDINEKRILFMSVSQLKKYLNWSNDIKNHHPILLLKELIKQDNSICYKYFVDLLELLNSDQESIIELIEPQLTIIDILAPKFKDRSFYVVNNNDDNNIDPCTKLCNNTFDNFEEYNIEEVLSDLPDFNIKDKINDLFKIEDNITQSEPIIHKQQEPISTEKKEKENTSTSVIITTPIRHKVFSRLGTVQRSDTFRNRLPNTSRPPSLHVDDFVAMETRSVRQPRYKLPIQPIQDLNIRLRERQIAYERTYSLLSPYKSHFSLHSWHAQINAMAHLRADYHQTISSRHLEIQRHSLVAEWRQLRVEAVLRKKRAYSRR